MYLFYAERNGWIPAGSDGQLKLPRNNMSRRAIEDVARKFIGNRAGVIYLMHEWTQQMSELGPWAFSWYIARNGEKVVYN